MSSYGDFIALSDVCDEATALLIKREVSDGVIAPGFTPEALTILQEKRKGTYCVLKVDENYRPEPIERKQVYGVTFEQGRNEINLADDALFENRPTVNKDIPEAARRDLMVALIILKYTQSNSVAAKPYSLHTSCRTESRHLVVASASQGDEFAICGKDSPCRS